MAYFCTMDMLNTDPTRTAVINQMKDIDATLIFFSDEAWFHHNGHMKSHSNRQWSEENPISMNYQHMPFWLECGVL
jgi:hypothetical protein